MRPTDDITRREFVAVTAVAATLSAATAEADSTGHPSASVRCSLTINGQPHDLDLDPRVTLLDLLAKELYEQHYGPWMKARSIAK